MKRQIEYDPATSPCILDVQIEYTMRLIGARAHKLVSRQRKVWVISDSKILPEGATMIKTYEQDKPLGPKTWYSQIPGTY